MVYTAAYLQLKGVMIPDKGEYSAARNALVRESITTLMKKDFATQDITGRYVDHMFESITYVDINPLSSKQDIEEQKNAIEKAVGWRQSKKVRVKAERMDEVCSVVALSCMIGSVPDGPGDITMNSFRYYDVLTMLRGDDFDSGGSFRLKEDTPTMVRYFRYRYFKFIVSQLKPYIKDFTYEECLAGLYNMQTYQLMPCLAAAFVVKERYEEWNEVRLSYPIIEIRNWTSNALADLENARISDTPEWVKFIPLVDDEQKFLNSTISTAVINLPFQETGYDSPELMKQQHFHGIAPMWNSSVLDYFGSFKESWWERLKNMGNLPNDYPGYLISYNVTIKGYWLAEDNFKEGDSIKTLYDDLVKPNLWSMIKESAEEQTDANYILTPTEPERLNKAIKVVSTILDEAELDILNPVLDYTQRRNKLRSSLEMNGNILPLFYSFKGEGISYTSTNEGD